MNDWRLTISYLLYRPLNACLTLLLLAFGVATIIAMLLVTSQLKGYFARDLEGIDLVVGAKGSPLQLILSSVFHVDIPTGNIPLAEAEKITANPMVKQAIPLALGDSYQGFRIVGTTPAYPQHYGADAPSSGRWWGTEMEVVLGADVAEKTGAKLGDSIIGSHGLVGGGELHSDFPYKVVGVLPRTHRVIDRLVLTDISSVWHIHEHHHHHHDEEGYHDEAHDGDHDDDHDEDEVAWGCDTLSISKCPLGARGEPHVSVQQVRAYGESNGRQRGMKIGKGYEITALLVAYKTPLAAATLPRLINKEMSLQAASPAFESARLLHLMGVGVDTITAFGYVFIAIAALSVFITLYNAMKERHYDIAIMRVLGGSRGKIFTLILREGALLTLCGTLLGIVLGHSVAEGLGRYLAASQQIYVTGFTAIGAEGVVAAAAFAVGLLAAFIPAVQAYRLDVAKLLSKG